MKYITQPHKLCIVDNSNANVDSENKSTTIKPTTTKESNGKYKRHLMHMYKKI